MADWKRYLPEGRLPVTDGRQPCQRGGSPMPMGRTNRAFQHGQLKTAKEE